MFKLRVILFSLIFVCFACTTSLASPNALTFQLRTFYFVVPTIGIGYSLSNGDALEVNYTNVDFSLFGKCTYSAFVYSLQLNSSENYRTAFDFGVMSYDYTGSTQGFGIGFPGPTTPPAHSSGILPVILYEQERTFGRDFSWLINIGYPNIFGLGLKYYLSDEKR